MTAIHIGRHTILVGDVRDRLRDLPDNSVHCCVTSPPYFGLRDYGTAKWDGGDPACDHVEMASGMSAKNTLGHNGNLPPTNSANVGRVRQYARECGKCGAVRIDNQIGLEPTLAEFIATMVDVFREVRRVLRPDGTLWLNIGDSYAGGGRGGNPEDSPFRKQATNAGSLVAPTPLAATGLKPKDLMMVPARLAIALQDDGWWLRSDIIWAKKAPMPESVTDRPTSAHEHIFLLAKQPRYYYDADAVREPWESGRDDMRTKGVRTGLGYLGSSIDNSRKDAEFGDGARVNGESPLGRNQRNVWTLGPEPFPEAHFATFPTEIPRRAIKAGTSERGVCASCGAPWARQVERQGTYAERKALGHDKPANWWVSPTAHNSIHPKGMTHDLNSVSVTTGWAPSCACEADVIPATVLDPFLGSGTTMLVADQLGRTGIGVELNPEYAAMAERRVRSDAPLLAGVA